MGINCNQIIDQDLCFAAGCASCSDSHGFYCSNNCLWNQPWIWVVTILLPLLFCVIPLIVCCIIVSGKSKKDRERRMMEMKIAQEMQENQANAVYNPAPAPAPYYPGYGVEVPQGEPYNPPMEGTPVVVQCPPIVETEALAPQVPPPHAPSLKPTGVQPGYAPFMPGAPVYHQRSATLDGQEIAQPDTAEVNVAQQVAFWDRMDSMQTPPVPSPRGDNLGVVTAQPGISP